VIEHSGSECTRTSRVGRLALAGLIVCLSVVHAGAQVKPNFSGRWTIEPTPSSAGAGAARPAAPSRRGDMGSGWGPDITISQDANRLTVEYVFFGRGDMQPPLKFAYALDGSEAKNSVMMGRGVQEQLSKTAWDGDNLVITTLHAFPNPTTGKTMKEEVKRTLLLESPTSLVVETIRVGVLGGPSSTSRTIYRKP